MRKVLTLTLLLYLVVLSILSLLPLCRAAWSEDPYIFIASWNGSSWSDPVAVSIIDYFNATRDSFQRKTWKTEAGNYFIIYYNENCKSTQYLASSDRITWQSATNISEFNVYPYSNMDVNYPCHQSAYHGAWSYSGSNGASHYWKPFNITSLTITEFSGGGLGGLLLSLGSSVMSNLDGTFDFAVFHRNTTLNPNGRIVVQRSPAMDTDHDTSVPYGDGTSGGNQILPYNTSSPYHMVVISKGNDQNLYYNKVNETSKLFFYDSFIDLNVTCGVGFNDFCATSEAQDLGDPEKIHLVFGNSSGLFYMKFENDVWSSETDLGVSGSYPTLSADDSGNLLVTYVTGAKIHYLTKPSGGAWSSEATLTGSYRNPEYCSSNHNMDSGEILLVWTAQNQITEPPFRAASIAAPYAYAAISLMSLSLIIGVAAAFISGFQNQDMAALIPVVIVGIGITVALFIALPILNAFMGM